MRTLVPPVEEVSVFTSLIRRAPAALSWRAACRHPRAGRLRAAAARRVRDASARHLARSPRLPRVVGRYRDTVARCASLAGSRASGAVGLPAAGRWRHRAADAHRARAGGDEDARHAVLHRDRGHDRQAAARRGAVRGRSRRARADAGRRSELPRYRSRDGRAQHAPEHRDPRVQPVRRIAARHGRAHGQLLHADRQLHAPDAQQGDDRGQPARDRRRPQSRRRILQCGFRHCSSAISTCWPPAP